MVKTNSLLDESTPGSVTALKKLYELDSSSVGFQTPMGVEKFKLDEHDREPEHFRIDDENFGQDHAEKFLNHGVEVKERVKTSNWFSLAGLIGSSSAASATAS